MASIINASTSGVGGVITTADSSGTLDLQSGGVTKASVKSGGFDVGGQYITPYTGFKNRIINGDMRVDQRYAGAASANTINGYFLDRWQVSQSVTGKIIAQQNAGSVTPPAGFTKYLGVTSQSAYSVGAGDYYRIWQIVEGLNAGDLGWGTANAQTVTLSFWVRSSLTGTFGGCIGNTSGGRSYPFSYTISSANTWEQKTITIVGDTSGTYPTDNTGCIALQFGIGVGSTYSGTAGAWVSSGLISVTGATSVVGTNGATFYITGVQLEKGSTATSFDYRPYGTELALCQRYYQIFQPISAMFPWGSGTQVIRVTSSFQVTMRTNPSTITLGTPSGSGTLTVVDASAYGLVFGGAGSTQNVVYYLTPKAEAEL